MTTTAWVIAVVAVGVVLAAWATYAIVTSGLYERQQVIVQVVLAWLVPVLGPIALLLVVRSLRERSRPRSKIENEQNGDELPGAGNIGGGGGGGLGGGD